MSTAIFDTIDTPDGPFTILAGDDGAVLASGWTSSAERMLSRVRPADRPAGARHGAAPAAAEAVAAYYAGELNAIDAVAVRHYGTELQRRGWEALRRIAPGAPLTYAEFAAELGSPNAVRAAASICAKNAPALFTPCHRVLRSDGTLGGFAWGLDVKRALLTREAA